MEYPSHHPEGLKPDELPQIDIDKERSGNTRNIDPYRELAAGKLAHYMHTLSEAHPLAQTKLADIPSLSNSRLAGIVAMPVRIGREPLEGVQETVQSIQEAAKEIGGNVLLLADFNYTVKERRQKEQAEAIRDQARAMQAGIEEVVAQGKQAPLGLVVVHHETHEGATISLTRQRQFNTALWLLKNDRSRNRIDYGRSLTTERALLAAYDIPYMTCDADSPLSNNALAAAFETLGQDKALLASGKLRYKGQIIDTTPEQARYLIPDQRLIYITEVLRRKMFDHLEATAFRGYVPESGLAMKLGVVASLNGYETRDTDNESYWLQVRAIKALRQVYNPTLAFHALHPRSEAISLDDMGDQPFVDFAIARRLESLVRYDDYLIQASERGIPEMVKQRGRMALAGFDQGDDYQMWTHLTPTGREAFNDAEPSEGELHALLNAIYSYQVDSGGRIVAHELHAYNDLLRQLFPRNHMMWLPQYVDKTERQATYTQAVDQPGYSTELQPHI